MKTKRHYRPDLEWSKWVAESVVDELSVAKLIPEDQVNWARDIVAQDIHIKLLAGWRPQENVSSWRMPYGLNNQFMKALSGLIDDWCDKRCLRPLSRVLGPFLNFNGLTDGWADLATGLKSVRAQDQSALSSEEMAIINGLIQTTDEARRAD
ncbi:hypothetical protein [Bradyrhizobium sp. dw_411]|uniref:hypothetical protein n=1 Tax=Bradyrhizobium sp. dw_411 TaxID=2720082 RepID=UPI001BCCF749|nr:hypothetical protein [Bradyrhizobium sp. dw_411]